MGIKKFFVDKNFFVKDFLKSYCLLCVVLFFKTALPNLVINNFFIILDIYTFKTIKLVFRITLIIFKRISSI